MKATASVPDVWRPSLGLSRDMALGVTIVTRILVHQAHQQSGCGGAVNFQDVGSE
jgi:hypothetical protein